MPEIIYGGGNKAPLVFENDTQAVSPDVEWVEADSFLRKMESVYPQRKSHKQIRLFPRKDTLSGIVGVTYHSYYVRRDGKDVYYPAWIVPVSFTPDMKSCKRAVSFEFHKWGGADEALYFSAKCRKDYENGLERKNLHDFYEKYIY